MVGTRWTAALAVLASGARAFSPAANVKRSAFASNFIAGSRRATCAALVPSSRPTSSSSSSSSSSLSMASVVPVPPLCIGELVLTPSPSANIGISKTLPAEWSGDLIVVIVHAQEEDKDAKEEGKPAALATLAGVAADLDSRLGGAISDLIATEEFKGSAKSSVTAALAGSDLPVKRVAVVGMGKASDLAAGGAKKSLAFAGLGDVLAGLAKSSKCGSMGVVLPAEVDLDAVHLITENILVELYQDTRYKSDPEGKKPLKLTAVDFLSTKLDQAATAAPDAGHIAAAVNLCKDLVNSPPNFVTPQSLADSAVAIAKEHGLEYTILEEPEIVKRGMGAYMGVAQGAVHPPKFIHLTYKPTGEIKKRIAIVGKGLTFDSGGYNLKVGGGSLIEKMKFDMGGSAATLGAAKAIGSLSPPGVEVHFIVAACENMVSDKAMRPGDILTASNGKTIEVINTDAEGRLTLADALVYAEQQGVEACVDCATLTGACMVGLGAKYAALYANDDDLGASLADAASKRGELIWRMPLAEEYEEAIKSKIADLQNVGGPYGGSITAALFLQHFVKKMKWAHIDLAGPVWNHGKVGATGYGVRLLTEWAVSQGK